MHPSLSISRSGKFCLSFPYHAGLISKVRCIPDAKWNSIKKLWEIPANYGNYQTITRIFSETLNCSPSAISFPMRAELKRRNYSRKTIRAYSGHCKGFFSFIKKQPRAILSEDIKLYLSYIIDHRKVSSSTVRQCVHSLKFFFHFVQLRYLEFVFPTVKRERNLPEILSEKEVLKILNFNTNPKHKLLLKLAYSSGLRVSELVRLKWSDLDLERKVMRVHQGKGKKDRITVLSHQTKNWLSEYQCCKLFIRKNPYLFPGQSGLGHLTERSAQKVFQSILNQCEIKKNLSIHSLRHAFATHMLEQGTDIRYIQKLLGHQSLKTTQIYTHVAKTSLENLSSPIDHLV